MSKHAGGVNGVALLEEQQKIQTINDVKDFCILTPRLVKSERQQT